jgi:hypothetical protein
MTVNEAYKIALSLDDTTTEQDDSLRPHMVNYTNLFLTETFRNENAIRLMNKRPTLKAIPYVYSINDSIPYDEELVRSGLPFFIASQIAKSDADNAWASRYYEMYINAVRDVTPFIDEPNIDVWGKHE